MGNLIAELNGYALRVSLALLAVTILIAWFMARHMKKTVADPIDEIARAATAYVEDKKEGIEKNHFADLEIRTEDEIQNLAEVMADMESELAQHEERITMITAQEERISTELGMAKKIQKSMLPGIFPPYPDRQEFDIYASMEPAREVGGDFYDFFPHRR